MMCSRLQPGFCSLGAFCEHSWLAECFSLMHDSKCRTVCTPPYCITLHTLSGLTWSPTQGDQGAEAEGC